MPDTFSHTARVTASRDRVWATLQRAETWSNVGPIDEVWGAEHDDEGLLRGYQWSASAAGRTWKGTATTVETEPASRMRLDLASAEIVGAITVELHDHQVTVSMEAAPNGLLAQMFWGTVKRALELGLPKQVEAFAAGLG